MTQLPDFARLPGDIVGMPPYRAEGCRLQAMLLKGSRALQQAYVDKTLNRPSEGKYVFHAVTDLVLLSAIHVDTMRSLDPIDSQRGVVSEADVGFWTLVRGGPREDQSAWRFYWLPSFLYVDSASAMSSGRECYGYPKTASLFSGVALANDDPSVEIRTLHMQKYRPAERPIDEIVLRISVDNAPMEAAETGGSEVLAKEAWRALGVATAPVSGPPSQISMPQIMLRQFRDPFKLGRATIQQGLIAPVRPVAMRDWGLLRPATVTLTPSASHSIAETLGVGLVSKARGFWIDQDFELGAATLLWG